ncbi:MAG: DsbA family protein [Paracoccaceae bacterium]
MTNFRTCLTGMKLALMASPLPAHEPDFDARIRDYILNNPEIIVEALEVLSQREAQTALVRKLTQFPDLFTRAPVLGLGDPAAPVRVVELFDYRCTPCKAAHPQLKALVAANPQLRIEMRHLPILSPGSERAARFALAVLELYGPDRYAAVHARLWTQKGPLNTAGFAQIAEQEALDIGAVEAAMDAPWINDRINANRDLAIALDIRGTPAFISQNSVAVGASDLRALAEGWLRN